MDAPIHPVVRETAHWLSAELLDEELLGNPEAIKPHFVTWLTGFRIVREEFYRKADSFRLIDVTSQLANRFYDDLLHQQHYSPIERIQLLFYLSRALLMACGYFPHQIAQNTFRPESDDPYDYLTVENLHTGKYANLLRAVQALVEDTNRLDHGYYFELPLSRLDDPFLTDN
ncbi:hypothetical protein GO755_29810 [Spirosoma sp. HMF4905]|uniref:Uncharacterized protein n=1 Tax=Spirosoma arboris TaxID=2682092 RepID=A0A7K1SKH9_9BACT|nr:hypothetical protein [Spirosoma arboris]MVM34264.1 hypothetical protein [Spirosoma arboris]